MPCGIAFYRGTGSSSGMASCSSAAKARASWTARRSRAIEVVADETLMSGQGRISDVLNNFERAGNGWYPSRRIP
jgi:hypothetical protein